MKTNHCVFRQMALRRLFKLSSLLRSAVSLTLGRNIGISAVVFNRAKELDPVQKLFLDKIRDYNTKSKSVDDALTDEIFTANALENYQGLLLLRQHAV